MVIYLSYERRILQPQPRRKRSEVWKILTKGGYLVIWLKVLEPHLEVVQHGTKTNTAVTGPHLELNQAKKSRAKGSVSHSRLELLIIPLKRRKTQNSPKNPQFGALISGGAISRVIPHTTVVFPSRIREEEGAVEIDPGDGLNGRMLQFVDFLERTVLGDGFDSKDSPTLALASLQPSLSPAAVLFNNLPSGRTPSAKNLSR